MKKIGTWNIICLICCVFDLVMGIKCAATGLYGEMGIWFALSAMVGVPTGMILWSRRV